MIPYEMSRKDKSMETGIGGCQGLEGGDNRECLIMGRRLFRGVTKYLELDSGDCETL